MPGLRRPLLVALVVLATVPIAWAVHAAVHALPAGVRARAIRQPVARTPVVGPVSQQLNARIERSRIAYKQLPPRAIARAAVAKFSHDLSGSAPGAVRLADGARVVRFTTDHSAQIVKGKLRGIYDSTLPIAVRGARGRMLPIKLDLVRRGGDWAPARPLVDVGFPGVITRGMKLGRLLRAVPQIAADGAAAQPLELGHSRLLYPDVKRDTDFIVEPSPVGFETYFQLRSPESPTVETIRNLPAAGVSLRRAGDAIALLRHGKRVGTILPPTAVDAAGRAVPVSQVLLGNDLHLQISHREPGVTYPVLVDPGYVTDDWIHSSLTNPVWHNGNANGLEAWKFWSNHPSITSGNSCWEASGNCSDGSTLGLFIQASPVYYQNGNLGFWQYQAPGAGPSYAWISTFGVGPLTFNTHGGPTTAYGEFYIMNSANNAVVSSWSTSSNYGPSGQLYISDPNATSTGATHGDLARVQLGFSSDGARTTWNTLTVGGAYVQMYEGTNSYPALETYTLGWNPDQWYSGTDPVDPTVQFVNLGFGIAYNEWTTWQPGQWPSGVRDQALRTLNDGCDGTYLKRCSLRFQTPMVVPTAQMQEGVNRVQFSAASPSGQGSDGSTNAFTYRVDRTAPTIQLSGPLYDNQAYPLTGDAFDLDYGAVDCSGTSDAQLRSGIKTITVEVDGTIASTLSNPASQTCSSAGVFTLRPADYTLPTHEIRVTAIDYAGNTSTTVFAVDVAAPDWTASATDWKIDPNDADTVSDDSLASNDDSTCYSDSDPDASSYCGQDAQTNGLKTLALEEAPLSQNQMSPLLMPATLETSSSTPSLTASQYGLSDQNSRTFQDSRFARLDVQRVRRNVPWNVVLRGPAPLGDGSDVVTFNQVNSWIRAARNDEILVSFEHTRGETCQTTGCHLPTLREYKAAVLAFRQQWPQVTLFTAWNEPNHASQPTADAYHQSGGIDRAVRAGEYWRILDEVCDHPPSGVSPCIVAAGDFLDSSEWTVDYLRRYRMGAGYSPDFWAWHAYGSGSHRSHNRLTSFLNHTRSTSHVWLTEQGGVVGYYDASGVRHTQTEAKARGDADYLFNSIANNLNSRITRFYYYQWKGDNWWDSGLIDLQGSRRDTYCDFSQLTNPASPVTSC